MIEKTPIDIYRESRVKSIYIELSRNHRAANSYALQIRGLERKFNFSNVDRDTGFRIINDIQKMYIFYNIVYKNLDTRTIIRDWMLYKIDDTRNHERTMDNMIRAGKRDIQQYGRVPTQRVKGFKRVNSKTMPPIEKTW